VGSGAPGRHVAAALAAARARVLTARRGCGCVAGPIKVTIIKLENGQQKTLYETDQRNLFSKYADKRCVSAPALPRRRFTASSDRAVQGASSLPHVCLHAGCAYDGHTRSLAHARVQHQGDRRDQGGR